jgi:hypothetical protein
VIRARRMLVATLALAWLGAGAAGASAGTAAEAERPLVLAIVVDGLDGDSVDAGRAPFLSSLLRGEGARAAYFPESRAILPAVTNANHMAMMSGAYAGDSGIPGNGFALYTPLENEDTCVATGPEDLGMMPSYTSGESPSCPQAEMVFEAIKRQGAGDRPTSAAIFGKPKLGRIFAGQNHQAGTRDVDYLWAPCSSGADDDEYCGSAPTNPVTGYAVDDATVMDEVIRTMRDGIPADGATVRPDFTFVNLPQVDSAGHAFGRGPVYDQSIALADNEIERLVTTLRELGEWGRTVLILVSDHSMDSTPQKIDLAAVFEDAGIPEDAFRDVPGDNGSVNLVYLANRTAADRQALLARMREIALATPGVSGAYYREANPADGGSANTVDRAHPDWHASGPRVGDLFVTAAPDATFAAAGSAASLLSGHHGAEQTRDNFFAVIGGSELVRQRTVPGTAAPDFDDTAQNPQQAENVDVAATVMGLFGLAAPEDNAGRFLDEAFDERTLATMAAPRKPKLRVRDAGRDELLAKLRPKGGAFDLQVREGKRWKKVLRSSEKTKAKVKGDEGERVTLRARAISAAGVKSDWKTRKAKF